MLQGFTDGYAEGAGGIWIFRKDLLTGRGQVTGAGDNFGPVSMHHCFSVWFLIKRDPDHIDHAVQTELLGGEGKGAAPLAGPGLGGDVLDAGLLVVEGLRNTAVGLVAA